MTGLVPHAYHHLRRWLLLYDFANKVENGRYPILASKAIRDQAILAVMVGTGLRWSEVAGLTWEMIQQRDGRWAIINLVGKWGRVRSVGIPPWVKVALDRWKEVSGVRDGRFDHAQCRRIFRALNKDGGLAGSVNTKGGGRTDGNLTPQAIYNVVKEHALAAGYINRKGEPLLAAHDLRRTAAALALKGAIPWLDERLRAVVVVKWTTPHLTLPGLLITLHEPTIRPRPLP